MTRLSMVLLLVFCVTDHVGGQTHTFIIGPVQEDMRNVLLETRVPKPSAVTSPILRDGKSGKAVPCQIFESLVGQDVEVLWLVDQLAKGEIREWKFSWTEEETAPRVRIQKAADGGKYAVQIDGQDFTTYHVGSDARIPFFYPLLVDGQGLTRSFPMTKGVPGENSDHPHHVSLWFAHGLVNDADFWHGKENRVKQVQLVLKEEGPVFGLLRERYEWLVGGEKMKVLDDQRTYRFIPLADGGRALDVTLKLKAKVAVKFGDTKEGSFAVRVAGSIKESSGGVLSSSAGKSGSSETWGKRASWMDYSGKLSGKNYGLAILDHPGSHGHPVHWHARGYGLLAANPFGHHHFYRDDSRDGSLSLAPGEIVTFRYRVIFHRGDAGQANIAESYAGYARSPKVRTYIGLVK